MVGRLGGPASVQQHPDTSGASQRFDTEIPIFIGSQVYGRLQFGLSIEFLNQARAQLVRESTVIALVEVGLSIVLLVLLGTWLTRHLATLETPVVRWGGNFDVNVTIAGNDEIAHAGQSLQCHDGRDQVPSGRTGQSEALSHAD